MNTHQRLIAPLEDVVITSSGSPRCAVCGGTFASHRPLTYAAQGPTPAGSMPCPLDLAGGAS